jgi:hypothetical protein
MGYLSGSGELEIVWKGVEKWVRCLKTSLFREIFNMPTTVRVPPED